MCDYKKIKIRGYSVSWIQVPETTENFLKHCALCKDVLKGFKRFAEGAANTDTKFFAIIFSEENNYAKQLAKNFEEENEIEFGSLSFNTKNLESEISIFTLGFTPKEKERLLIIAPRSALEDFLKK